MNTTCVFLGGAGPPWPRGANGKSARHQLVSPAGLLKSVSWRTVPTCRSDISREVLSTHSSTPLEYILCHELNRSHHLTRGILVVVG